MTLLHIHRRVFQLRARLFSSQQKRFQIAEQKRKKRAERLRLTAALAQHDFFMFIEFPLRMAAINAAHAIAVADANLKAARKRAGL